MSFITLEKMPTGGPGLRESRPYTSFSKPGTAGGKIYISGKLAEQMGWKRGDKVSLAIGTGNDFGTLRISRAANGYTLSGCGGDKSAALQVAFNHFNDTVKSFANTEIQHSIIGGALYVRLPDLIVTAAAAQNMPDVAMMSSSGTTTVYRNEQRGSA